MQSCHGNKTKNGVLLAIVALTLHIGCGENQEQTTVSQETEQDSLWIVHGQEITSDVFTNLSGRLKKALKKGGVGEAVKYCNLNADPLIDSLSKVHQAVIKRTSHKLRNIHNKPNKNEEDILAQYQENIIHKTIPTPIVQFDKKHVNYYAPIFLSKNCLQCHGKIGEDVSQDDYSLISKRYPEDKATGFEVGDLRGIWSLQFQNPGEN